MKIKICGITSIEDADYAIKSGADFVGVILDNNVVRHGDQKLIKNIKERHPEIKTVGVYTSMPEKAGYEDYVQLHYSHSGNDVYHAVNSLNRKVISVINPSENIRNEIYEHLNAGAEYVLIEDRSGIVNHINLLKSMDLARTGIAGKISPENVSSLVSLNPGLIDVSSSLEERPGKKSFSRIDEFFERIGESNACR